MKKILVTGGCGYIGSHTIVELINAGYECFSIDNNSNSYPWIMDRIEQITEKKIKNYNIDLTDYEALQKVLEEEGQIDGIIHFAALKAVGESVEKPVLYYKNNLGSLLNILTAMQEFDLNNLIFSSSCSIYGNPKVIPVTEETPIHKAESPYGATKIMGEEIISDFSKATSKSVVALRYFNPAGAHESALIGELPIGKPNTLVTVTTRVAAGKIEKLTVFGSDYDTRDGTCIRDYVHVSDIANAHVLALEYLFSKEKNYDYFNLGTGKGSTVLEVINAFEKIAGVKLNYEFGPRRPGDVEKTYADNNKAQTVLQWEPKRDLDEIMRSAWEWEKGL
ncbi:UDP-glucose 4-epimerase GalE [Candidatus Dojkabacteria bacterium]|uniref:UDP-glucose 4-epimerase n=1 Tax=Candidatus Dojkabacteria bacterium TaxID=2099670 RepID=A0A955L2Q2_9BACT|nr:UDP-glucose 4-epimerase GalE [Candidatus Dojkabacteria bacterium]